MRPSMLVLIPSLMLSTQAAGEPPANSQASGSPTLEDGPSEASWREAFDELHEALTLLGRCRAGLDDYCSWEYRKSREESEVQAFREYLEARRRGEDVEDPLANKVYVPEACQELFDRHPEEIVARPDGSLPEGCRRRFEALTREIDRVERYWTERGEELERRARQAGIPKAWRR
ncbi:MAG: hypothetical protein ACE5FG_01570 [Myxococcota bacterium]